MKKRLFSLLLALVMLVGMLPMNSLTAYATELTEAEQTAETLPVLLGMNVTLADILDTSDGWKPLPVDKSAVFEPGTGTASVNFSNSVLYTNGSFSTPVATVSAGGKYYFYITVTSLPEYYPVDYSKISVDHINVTMYDYKVDFLYASEYSSGAYTGMKFCFMATHNPAPQLKFDEIVLKDGEYLKSGTPITSTTKPSGGYAYYKDGVLELNNYNSTFGNLYLKDMESIEIKVVGSNVLSKIEETYTSTNTKKYTDITFTGDGSLNVKSNIPACVKTSGDVTIKGGNLTFGGGNALSGLSAASLTLKRGELVLKGTTSAINSGCTVDAAFIYVDENNTLWDGTTELSTYKYLRLDSPHIYVGGVKMYDGDYLAVGATETQSTELPGSYAYYNNDTLTLNYYAYKGIGYEARTEHFALIYAERDLTIELKGTNTLIQTADDGIAVEILDGNLTINGPGSFSSSSDNYGIYSEYGITINGGTIVSESEYDGIYAFKGDIIINGGDVTSSGVIGIGTWRKLIVNGGRVEALAVDTLSGNAIRALSFDGITIADGLKIQASTTVDGTMVDYVKADNDTYKRVVISVHTVYVGGVKMYDGDYLAVGAAATTTTQPSGGYAYYNNGTLSLNNYEYEGIGYEARTGHFALIYAERDLTIELKGTNTLIQTADDGIAVEILDGNLTINGPGSFSISSDNYGFYSEYGITINGGTIVSESEYCGIYAFKGDVIINDGDVTSSGILGIGTRNRLIVNGGRVEALAVDTLSDNAVRALTFDGITIADGLKIKASTTVDGTMVDYVKADNDTYKRVVISGPDVYVGGVGMCDGDYLAVGATTTQTTKPSGGYAYYKDGTLTLNNYSYEGEGYQYNSEKDYYAVIYSKNDLTLELTGNNTLTQPKSNSIMIYVCGAKLTVGGDGKLTGTSRGYALRADYDITINGGTIEVSTYLTCILSYGDVIINGGDIVAESVDRIGINTNDITINGGDVTAIGGSKAINCASDGFSVAEGMNIQASTTVDGELGEYVAANHNSYKKIVIEPAASTHTVTFKVGTATVDTKTVEDGKTVTAPTAPTQSGKTFLGWYNGSTKFDFTTPITADLTLTAKFEDATSTVKLGDVNLDGNVDYLDLQRLYQHLSTSNALTGEALAVANVNGDTTVDYFDLQRLYQHLSTDNKLF